MWRKDRRTQIIVRKYLKGIAESLFLDDEGFHQLEIFYHISSKNTLTKHHIL